MISGLGLSRVDRVERVEGEGMDGRVERVERVEGAEILAGYGGRLNYLKGYRDGTRNERVRLLKEAIKSLVASG